MPSSRPGCLHNKLTMPGSNIADMIFEIVNERLPRSDPETEMYRISQPLINLPVITTTEEYRDNLTQARSDDMVSPRNVRWETVDSNQCSNRQWRTFDLDGL